MKHYYYSNGHEKFGPFTLEELRGKEITLQTLIWSEGMTDWREAGRLDDFRSFIFSAGPPPLRNKSNNATQKESQKRNYRPVIYTVLTLMAIWIALIIISDISRSIDSNYAASSSLLLSEAREKTAEELKLELIEKERRQLLSYLDVDYEIIPTLGVRSRIQGTVYNTSTALNIKDAVIKMTFYTKTDTKISSENKTLYEYIDPGDSKSFDWKITTPKKTSYITLKVVDAVVVD